MKMTPTLLVLGASLALATGLSAWAEQPIDPASRPSPEQIERDRLDEVLANRVRVYEAKIEQLADLRRALETGVDLERIREQARATVESDDRPGRRWSDRPGSREGRDFRRGDRPDRERENTQPLPPETIDRALAFLRENRPEIAERLERLRAEKPEEFERAMQRLVRTILPAGGDVRRMEAYFELRSADREVRRLARRYRAAGTDEERAALRDELRAALRQAAEARLEFEERTIEAERARLARREAELARLRSEVEGSIEERLQALMSGEAEDRADGRRPRPEPSETGGPR